MKKINRFFLPILALVVVCIVHLSHISLTGRVVEEDLQIQRLAQQDQDQTIFGDLIFNLYNIIPPGPKRIKAVEAGYFPWWIDPAIKFSFFRPLPSLTLKFDYLLFGKQPTGYHAVNLLLIALSCLLFFIFVENYTNNSPWASLSVIMLGLTQFAQDTTAFICTRPEAVLLLLFLSCLVFYQNYLKTGKKVFWSYTFIAFVLALFTKSPSILIPLVLFALSLSLGKRARQLIYPLIPFFVTSLLYVAYYFQSTYGANLFKSYAIPASVTESFAMISATKLLYSLAKIFLGPATMSFIESDVVLVGILVTVVLVVFVTIRNDPKLLFFFSVPFLFTPIYSLFAQREIFANWHYLIPSVGSSALFGYFIVNLFNRKTVHQATTWIPALLAGTVALQSTFAGKQAIQYFAYVLSHDNQVLVRQIEDLEIASDRQILMITRKKYRQTDYYLSSLFKNHFGDGRTIQMLSPFAEPVDVEQLSPHSFALTAARKKRPRNGFSYNDINSIEKLSSSPESFNQYTGVIPGYDVFIEPGEAFIKLIYTFEQPLSSDEYMFVLCDSGPCRILKFES